MTLFVILAASMLAVALGFLLLPMLRVRERTAPASVSDPRRLKALDDALAAGVVNDEEYRVKRAALQSSTTSVSAPPTRRVAVVAALAVALLVPAGAVLLYQLIGEPDAFDPTQLVASTEPADAEHGVDMNKAITGLVAKLAENPDNAEGWALLGRAYQATGQFAESRDALKRAYDLSPDSHDLAVEYAQALALSGEGRRITGDSRKLLEDVLKVDPDHQRALWLIGISDFQAADYNAAITAWNRLLPALPADSDIARSVRTQIAEAQSLGGTVVAAETPTSNAPASTPPAASATEASDPKLTVQVSLDAKLKDRLESGATLFVFARAENGPPMPLAIQRVSASDLPLTVTLDDSMGMLPSMKLSMFPKVTIGARISSSGNALAQSGDLQVMSTAIDVNRKEPLSLVIDSVVP